MSEPHPLKGKKVVIELYNHDIISGFIDKITPSTVWMFREDTGILIDVPKNIALRTLVVFEGGKSNDKVMDTVDLDAI